MPKDLIVLKKFNWKEFGKKFVKFSNKSRLKGSKPIFLATFIVLSKFI